MIDWSSSRNILLLLCFHSKVWIRQLNFLLAEEHWTSIWRSILLQGLIAYLMANWSSSIARLNISVQHFRARLIFLYFIGLLLFRILHSTSTRTGIRKYSSQELKDQGLPGQEVQGLPGQEVQGLPGQEVQGLSLPFLQLASFLQLAVTWKLLNLLVCRISASRQSTRWEHLQVSHYLYEL